MVFAGVYMAFQNQITSNIREFEKVIVYMKTMFRCYSLAHYVYASIKVTLSSAVVLCDYVWLMFSLSVKSNVSGFKLACEI